MHRWHAVVPLCLLLLSGPALSAAEEPLEEVHRCDEFAAHPGDRSRWAEGVEDESIVPGPALKACQEAVEAYPETPRFKFQLGRVLLAAGREDEATAYFMEAADEGYPPATAYLALAFLNGWGGIEPDTTAAKELLEASIHGGFTVAEQILTEIEAAETGENADQSSDTAQELPFDPAVNPDRAARYRAPFEAEKFAYPPLSQALYDGDFDAVPRPIGILYIRKFHNMLSPEALGFAASHDPECPVVFDPAVEARAKQEIVAGVLGVGGSLLKELAQSPQTQNAAGQVAESLVRGLYGMDLQTAAGALSGLVWLETKIDQLHASVERDANVLKFTLGCEGPVATRLLHNIKAYVLGNEPMASPAVEQRRAIRKSAVSAQESCIKSFDTRFCGCAIGQLQSTGLDVPAWERIATDFRSVTTMDSPELGLREKLRACYG